MVITKIISSWIIIIIKIYFLNFSDIVSFRGYFHFVHIFFPWMEIMPDNVRYLDLKLVIPFIRKSSSNLLILNIKIDFLNLSVIVTFWEYIIFPIKNLQRRGVLFIKGVCDNDIIRSQCVFPQKL